MGATITFSTKLHSHPFPTHHRAAQVFSAIRENLHIATLLRSCMTAVVTVAAIAVFIQAATPFSNSGMVSMYLEASPFITVMPAD